jgi:predicted negative regulator of RcsB-dependent stress response
MRAETHYLLVEHMQLTYTFFAYAAVFAAMFLFTWRMYRRTQQLRQEVSMLLEEYEETVEHDARTGKPPLNG